MEVVYPKLTQIQLISLSTTASRERLQTLYHRTTGLLGVTDPLRKVTRVLVPQGPGYLVELSLVDKFD